MVDSPSDKYYRPSIFPSMASVTIVFRKGILRYTRAQSIVFSDHDKSTRPHAQKLETSVDVVLECFSYRGRAVFRGSSCLGFAPCNPSTIIHIMWRGKREGEYYCDNLRPCPRRREGASSGATRLTD